MSTSTKREHWSSKSGGLLVLLLCFWSCADVTLGTNPGLKIRISQPGLNYAASVAVQRMSAKVRGAALPDQSGSSHTPVGKVEYEVKNMRVTSFQQPSTSVTVNPDRGITWSLSGAGISLHGDWHIKYRVIFKVSDHGSFDASASGASISVSVTLGTSSTGNPTIRSTGCTCNIDRLRIRLHGGASWLYNLFMGSVEHSLRRNLQSKICQAAQNAINSDVSEELATLPVTVHIGRDKDWLLDYRLVASPAFKSGYLESSHKAEFFNAGDTSEAPFQPAPLPSPPAAERMATFWVSDYVLNTAGYVLQKRGILRYNLTKKDLPPDHQALLNTTCSILAGCIGAVVPQVGKQFPNASIEVEMFSSTSPTAAIDSHNITGNFAGILVLRARLSDGSLAHLFGMNVTAKMSITPRLEGITLKARVNSMDETLAITDSSVGHVSAALLGLAFNVAKNNFIVPKLNEVGERGFPIPAIKHIQFMNIGLQLEKDCLRVSTDVKYSPSILYFYPHH